MKRGTILCEICLTEQRLGRRKYPRKAWGYSTHSKKWLCLPHYEAESKHALADFMPIRSPGLEY